MKWFSNLKISIKLLASFILISLITGAMGIYSVYSLKANAKLDTELYENMTVPISEMGEISSEFQRLRVNVRDLIIAQTPESIQANIQMIEERRKNIDKLSDSFGKTILLKDIQKQYDAFVVSKNTFNSKIDKVIELEKQNKDAEAISMVAENGEAGKAAKAEQDVIEKIVSMKVDAAKAKSDLNTKNANSVVTIMIIVIVTVVLLSILIGIYISGLITKPIQKTLHMIQEMGKGHLSERLNIKTKDEVGQMAASMDSFADKLQTNVIGVMEAISNGDVSMEMVVKDEKDEITPVLKRTIDTVRNINNDVDKLIKAAQEGKLDTRGNADLYSGKWKDLLASINSLIDAFVAPINVTAEYIDRISKGDIPPKITDTYHGDFNETKNNFNNCIDVMNALLSETNKLIKAAEEGKLDTRGNADMFAGSWGTLVGGINNLVEAVVKPIKEVTVVMNEISEGNLNVSVNGNYAGEFEVLSTSVNSTANYLKSVVGEISKVIGQVSNGDLTMEHVVEYKGDFINISNSLNTIIDSLNSILSDINISAEQVSTGSSQVSSGSQALSQGSTEQASSIEELTSSITEIAAQTRENASNANQANELAFKVKENAEQGNRHMSEMLKAMGEINESSTNISKIIKVIDEIAFQTNILALNAAVEAARAGQHGKGFAVVAEEVRNLAARSANAAKETTDLIEGSMRKAEKGTEIANDTAKSLYEIVDGVSKAVTLVAEIAASCNEQASGISQINVGIEQVSQVVQTNSATAEESAAASEELSNQSELLKEMVGKFKLRDEDYGVPGGKIQMHNKKIDSSHEELSFKEAAAARNRPQITLSSKEFGKY